MSYRRRQRQRQDQRACHIYYHCINICGALNGFERFLRKVLLFGMVGASLELKFFFRRRSLRTSVNWCITISLWRHGFDVNGKCRYANSIRYTANRRTRTGHRLDLKSTQSDIEWCWQKNNHKADVLQMLYFDYPALELWVVMTFISINCSVLLFYYSHLYRDQPSGRSPKWKVSHWWVDDNRKFSQIRAHAHDVYFRFGFSIDVKCRLADWFMSTIDFSRIIYQSNATAPDLLSSSNHFGRRLSRPRTAAIDNMLNPKSEVSSGEPSPLAGQSFKSHDAHAAHNDRWTKECGTREGTQKKNRCCNRRRPFHFIENGILYRLMRVVVVVVVVVVDNENGNHFFWNLNVR